MRKAIPRNRMAATIRINASPRAESAVAAGDAASVATTTGATIPGVAPAGTRAADACMIFIEVGGGAAVASGDVLATGSTDVATGAAGCE